MKTDISTSSSVADRRARRRGLEGAHDPGARIKQWFFGVDTETDWKQGSPIVHRGEWQGKPYVDKGEIVRIEPPHLLVHTHWSDLSGKPDSPRALPGGHVGGRGAERRLRTARSPSTTSRPMKRRTPRIKAWSMVLQSLKGMLEDRDS